MNIAIIGSKNSKKLADVLYKMFDTVEVLSYVDVNEFRRAMLVRALDIHRMILFQEGIDNPDISDEELYDFQDMALTNFPAMNIVTVSKDVDFCKYLGDMFNGNNYAHFCVPSLKARMFVDMAQKSMKELEREYADFTYKAEVQSLEETIDVDAIFIEEPEIDKTDIPNYIPNDNIDNEHKRSFFDKIIGRHPPKKADLIKKEGLTQIGQGFTQEGFSEAPKGVDFGDNTGADIFGNTEEHEEVEFDYFGNDSELGVGLGLEHPDDNRPVVHLGKSDIDALEQENSEFEDEFAVDESKNIFGYEAPKETYIPFDIGKLEKEPIDFEPSLDIAHKDEDDIFEAPEEVDIPKVTIGLDALKKTMQETDVQVSEDAFIEQQMPDLMVDIEDIEVSNFEGDINSLMAQYDEQNRRNNMPPMPIPVPQVVPSKFRNKNGIKILIVTGDRRVGSTKLALNLANQYARKENKVLYVDLDRRRHGSLGYIDLDTLSDEPDHVQNGLEHLKSGNILKNVCHLYKKGKFFVLTSMYGTYVSDSHLLKVQEILASQRDFSTVVIDCPLEDLHLLTSIITFSRVLFCVEDDKVGIINFISTMESSFEDNETMMYNFFEKSYFVVGRRSNVDKFKKELNYVVDLFDLEESICKWNNVEILGTLKETDKLAERTAD